MGNILGRYIILLTHGSWGIECLKSAEMIIGDVDRVKAYPLNPEDNLDQYRTGILEMLKEQKIEKAIFLSDLKCGSTSQAASYLAYMTGGIAVSGLNLALLISAVRNRDVQNDELPGVMLEEGKNDISDIRFTG